MKLSGESYPLPFKRIPPDKILFWKSSARIALSHISTENSVLQGKTSALIVLSHNDRGVRTLIIKSNMSGVIY